MKKQLVMAVCLACMTSGVYAASSDYIAVNPEGVRPTATGAAGVAVGINTNATGRDSFAAGISSNANGRSSTAVGVGSRADGYRSTAVGNGGVASADNAIGIGGNASAISAISMGYQSQAAGLNNVAIGRSANAQGSTSMAIGSNTRTYDAENNNAERDALDALRGKYTMAGQTIDYVDTANTGSAQVAVGTNSHAGGWGASALGYQAYALNSQASALGDDAKALGYASSAVGTHTYASGRHATALGNGAEALGNQAAAIGAGAAATANNAIAMGWGAGASGENAIAIGTSTGTVKTWYTTGNAQASHATELSQWAASGARSIAIGTDALSTEQDSVALGSLATSITAGGVALGAESIADRAALTGVSASSSASAAANQVYAMETATDADKAAIVATVKGEQGAVSVGTAEQTRQITNVAAGSNDSDAVNVSQLKAVANTIKDVEVAAGNNVTVTSATEGNKTTYTVSADVGKSDINNLQTQITHNANIINNHEGRIVDLENRPDKDTVTTIAAGDNSVVVNNDGNNNYTIAVSDEIKKQINNNTTNINNMGQRINNLDHKIDKVGAGAAALAGLHPLDFNPDDKWNFAVGYGNYGNANAMAVGAFYRPNEDMMFNVAGTMGNGENMVSAGVSFNLGQSSGVSRSKVAMAKEIQTLESRLAQLEARLANGNGATGTAYPTMDVEFPDVPENHWAYAYVDDLASKGLLLGYPDGEFKGDRTMTRYEFAAVMYRALQNGAPVDGNMARATSEFGPEMAAVQQASRFRVDRVHGDENDRYKVERVRVNSEDKDTRDVYGGMIEKTK
ncbi:YadA-like family protein [Veillonella agrestimuris]|uniref:YadA-like family protein n=1 Tax=Veillonella agrestimuris TaxID=2941340 RepID=UPI00203C3A58|nr:YadA-like family protein [Veillonella agrestimuris]